MLVNKYNDQFIADKTSSRAGVTCSKPSLMSGGGPYGVTSESVNADVAAGLGKARPSAIGHYSHCNSQKGGSAGHDYDADSVGQTYGYTKAGAAYSGEVRGGYAPVTRQPKTNMCGGKRRRKNKSRKSRRKSRKKSKKGGRRRKTKRSRRKRRKSRKKSKSRRNRRRRTRKRMKGGRYQQYGSNVPNTPGYSGPYTAGPMPWATGPVGINRQMNC